MSAVVDRLRFGRGLAWAALVPVFDLAIAQAEQAEYEADRAANLAQASAAPAYPPLVMKLAESAGKAPSEPKP